MHIYFKNYQRFITLFVFTMFFLFNSCANENPVIPKVDENIVTTPFDPDAPVINKEWLNWIKLNSNEIKSLDSPDYSDLRFLGTFIQNKKIIQLGESSHGVKEFNKAKVRLIKYLHEKMGFNIIAFESSVFDCYYANVNEGKNGPSAMMKNSIFGVWYTEEVKELFSYIIQTQSTGNPLILAGFDIQPSSNGAKNRPEFLKSVIEKISSEKAISIFTLDSYIQTIDLSDKNKLTMVKDSLIAEYQKYMDLIENNWSKLIDAYPQNSIIPHIAKLTIRSNMKYISYRHYANMENAIATTEERDMNMAYNLEYLFKNVYSKEKIIVWAHNYHIGYNTAKVKNTYNTGSNSMGYYLHPNLSNELYTVGFYMYRGKVANNSRVPLDVTKSTSENIEAVLYHTGHHYSFVDMLSQDINSGNDWMINEMKAKYWGISDQLLVPKEQYDALLYIYETSLPVYLNYSLMKSKYISELTLNDYR